VIEAVIALVLSWVRRVFLNIVKTYLFKMKKSR
jgi:hypothetical protein